MENNTDTSLRQYIELYDSHKNALCSHCAPALNRLRAEAADRLRGMQLPSQGTEHYEITSLPQLLATDYGVNINRVNLEVNPASSFHCGIPRLSTSLFFLVNDSFARTPNSYNGLPEGLTIGSLNTLAAEKPELVEPYYCSLASPDNPLVALNTMLVQDGILIHVAKGTRVEKTIQTVNILRSITPLMAVRRLLVVLEEGASLKMLACDHSQNGDMPLMSLETIEVILGDHAEFEYYDLEESSPSTVRLNSTYVRLGHHSKAIFDTITLSNGNTRNELNVEIAGKEASLQLAGMGIIDGDRTLDNYSYVNHGSGHSHTDELYKYILDDRARGAFTGLINVAEGAEKTEAYQANRNIVGSDEARMFSKPQLIILNDDVKCSHGTAIGKFDEMQVFYMRSRGLSDREAHTLLKQAFLADVVDKVKLPQLHERLNYLVERRISGHDITCATCHNCNIPE